ncbi:MMPL family transporter [Terrabacter aeriphilus]|uniref:MMPL family transporter n=1 Tax=Terrabacter aeriphilus TaxID=515662 RepID=A0ABP9JEI5_9MICO
MTPEQPAETGLFGRYAAWTVRRRWYIVVGWLIALGGLVALPPVGSGGNELASIIPLDSPAISSELRALDEFGFPLSSRVAVVQRAPEGLSLFVQAESALDALAVNQGPKPEWPLLGALPITNSLKLFGPGGETNTSVLTYLFMDPISSFQSQQDAAQRYIDQHLERREDHVVGVAGSVPARAQQAGLVGDNISRLELLTVLAIIALVGFTFRSVLAPAIALVASGIAFVATISLSEVLSGLAGISTPAELEPLLVALLLGVVTDYTIFYVTALQARIAATARWRDAVRAAVSTDTPIVLAAGITVAAGTAALLAAKSEFFRAFGPAMALAVLVGLIVSVTFVPASIAVLGPAVFWPRDPRRARLARRTRPVPGIAALRRLRPAPGPDTPGRRRIRLVHLLANRPTAAAVVVGCVALLLAASASVRDLDLGVGFTSSLPPDNPVAVASTSASDAFAPGITSPTTILIERPDVVDDVDLLVGLQHLIEGESGVAGVVGPAQNITQRAYNVVLSESGNAARMLIVFDHDPLDATAITDLRSLRDRLPALVQEAGLTGARTSLGGDTALAEGLVGSTEADLYRIAVAGIVVNLLLLVLFLRALVAPLFLLASSVLALTASLGLTVFLFGGLGGVDGLTFYVPFAAAVLLVSLGSDYNIFGVGRVWEEARHLPLREAVLKAVPESSRAITSAGVTLAVSFGMLALIPLTPFRELAFAMAVGILIDAFVVRSLLVPAMLVLVGPFSGWPGPHLRGDRRSRR